MVRGCAAVPGVRARAAVMREALVIAAAVALVLAGIVVGVLAVLLVEELSR